MAHPVKLAKTDKRNIFNCRIVFSFPWSTYTKNRERENDKQLTAIWRYNGIPDQSKGATANGLLR